jgi:hypothetical protein
MLKKKRDVLASLPQGRNLERHNVETVIKVRAEGPLLDELPQVGLRGRNDPHCDLDELV